MNTNFSEQAGKNLPRDVFLYIFSTIGLITIAIAFGTLAFQIINSYLPDVLSYRPLQSIYGSIRWAVAVLVVVFPVYFGIMKFLNKDAFIFPDKKELRIRKWLLHFAVFAAAIVIVIDLVVLIYYFLQGELTTRFILKILVVLAIAGIIFAYYFKILKDRQEKIYSWIPWVAVILIAGFIIGGVATAGLPQSQRLVRLDQKRVEDLYNLEYHIVEYWRRSGVLPSSLENLKELNFPLMVDPETGEAYEYRIIELMKFEICANFKTSAEEKGDWPRKLSPDVSTQFRFELENHGVDKQCFEREVNLLEIKPAIRDNGPIL